jgi:hypothetical protein
MTYEVLVHHQDGNSIHIGIADGRVVWHSVLEEDVADEVRLNLDYPTAARIEVGEPIRFRFPDQAEARRLRIEEEDHRFLAAHAAARFLIDGGQAAEIVGIDRQRVDAAAGVLLDGVADGEVEAAEEQARGMIAEP